jgi:hypothetical protein
MASHPIVGQMFGVRILSVGAFPTRNMRTDSRMLDDAVDLDLAEVAHCFLCGATRILLMGCRGDLV